MKKLIIITLSYLLISTSIFAMVPPTPNSSGSGNCLVFDGVSNYVDIGNIATGIQGSMEAWINPDGNYTNTQHVAMGAASNGANSSIRYGIMMRHSSACAGQWGTILGNGTASQVVCSGQAYNAINFPVGVWTHVCITYDGSTIRFYKDGSLINTIAQTVSGAGNAQPYSIGRGGAFVGIPTNTGYFPGQIDEVRIWNSARTQVQIRDNMCHTLMGTEPNLVGYWTFDDDPTISCGGTPVVPVTCDISSNGNNGTLN